MNKIPLATLRTAQSKLNEVVEMLRPYLVVLSPAERHALVKMRAEYVQFIDVSHRLAVEHPELFADFFEVMIVGEDFFIPSKRRKQH